ncbi:MAG: hypothetical protein ACRCXC_02545 [Legionella sp.]
MPKFDTAHYEQTQYTIEFSRQTEEEINQVYLSHASIIFKDESLCRLFKEYVQKS